MESPTIRYLEQLAEFEPEIVLNKLPPVKADASADDRQIRLTDLSLQAMGCIKCPLSENRRNVVFGVGNPRAQILFVGEGPGADEDRLGEPFVGRAGQLLNKILGAMKLRREDVYIGNIVKCRPPNNRPPLPAEAMTCLPYIERQIEIISPKVVVALGVIAASYLLGLKPGVTMKSLRGRIHNYRGTPLIATYHPAALLRDASYKAPTWEDMQTVMKLRAGEIVWRPEAGY